MSQLDEGAAPVMECVDLLEIAKDVSEMLQSSAAEKNICLSVTGESTVFNGVRSFLHEMIYNLCDNAIRYNVENGDIAITVCNDGNGPAVTVKDTGIGIPPEYQDRVFERFFRVDKSRSKASGGTRLGLSIVKHIAQYHHAAISLNSVPNHGTSVSITFPVM